MANILPSQTGLTIEAIYHEYRITKPEDADATVNIKNEYANGTGYIYTHSDNWDGIAGNTKKRYDPIASSLGMLWGDGSISVDGTGTLSDVNVLYHYKFDPCAIALSDPSCKGYEDALLKYLMDNNLINNNPSVDDPYYSDVVQFQLDQKIEQEEFELAEAQLEEEAKEETSLEDTLSVTDGAASIIDDPAKQLKMLQEMSGVAKIATYYQISIDGGMYEDTIVLDDGDLKDNWKALKHLNQNSVHKKMVREQYN